MTGSAEPQYLVPAQAGEFVFREGEPGKEMFIIQKGKVEILKKFRKADRRVSLLEEGDFFGEMAILEDLPRTVSARAKTDCVLLRIDDATFDQMVRRNPEIPVRMLRKLARRLRETNALLFGEGSEEAELSAVVGPEEAGRAAASATESPVAARPRLVHESGTEFPLAAGDVTAVGRTDAATGFEPDVELTSVDPQRSTSRRHAKIIRRGDRHFLREEIGTANGTHVAGVRVEAGAEVELENGVEVRFGLVTMVFRTD
jgi:CRP-like cAMP-binding protein